MRKIKYFFILSILFLIETNIFSVSMVSLWEKKYFGAKNIKEKSEILLEISKKATAEYEELILKILQDQADLVLPGEPQNFRYHEDCVYTITDIILKLKIKKGNTELIKMYKKMINPLHKGMIAEAIGMINDKNDLVFLNEEIKTLNTRHRNAQYKNSDRLMYGLIKGLGYYNDKSSFNDIFYAAIPNYSKQIQNEAQIVLKNIAADPAPLCIDIIDNDPEPRMVLEALKYANNSASTNEGKIKCSQNALLRGLKQGNLSIREFVDVRDESCKYLGLFKATDAFTYELLSNKWKVDNDTNSRLITIETLEKIATEDSGKILASWLKKFIERKKQESSQNLTIKEEDKIILALIRALGNTAGEAGVEELFDISPIFGNNIVEAARKSLEKKGIK